MRLRVWRYCMDTYYTGMSTHFYDQVNPLREQEVSYYLKRFAKEDLILEPMCGSGRLLVPLVQAGLNVEGLDSSADMLGILEKRLQDLDHKPKLYQADVGTFVLEKRYDGIIIPYCSLNHLLDLSFIKTVFQNIFKHLKPGGVFLFETFHESSAWPWEEGPKENVRDGVRETLLFQEKLANGVEHFHYRYERVASEDKKQEEPEFKTFSLWLIKEKFLLDLLKEVGFEKACSLPSLSKNMVFFEAFKPKGAQ